MKDTSPSAQLDRLITLQQHILLEGSNFPDSSGEFSWLLSGITLATKMIQAQVRRAGLTGILGSEGTANVQGEIQQKLDVYADRVLLDCLGVRESIGVLASEENEKPFILRAGSPQAKYAVVFDPLDGSSNIDVNVSVGTTFSILRRPDLAETLGPESWLLQPGVRQVAAGYVLYGSSTVLVYSAGNGVHGFTLDPAIGAYVLSHEHMQMPKRGIYYSVNEAHRAAFAPGYNAFLDRLRAEGYSSRYIGSMVADVHRTLLKGGVFLYPGTKKAPEGKLRLLYEGSPMAYVIEQAGGLASTGRGPLLDVEPAKLHQRTPVVLGSAGEVEHVLRHLRG